ncbi:MAG: DUF4388 domain-containing protein [Candidatus Obscuribacter sp.]|nr:DUF4388 domain-containing protein [Candidatus Obscuribacter sp.]
MAFRLFSDAPATIAGATPRKENAIEGLIEQTPLNGVLTNIGMQQLTGKLEVIGDASVGHVYFESGIPKDAQTSTNRGDDAIKELVTWRRGSYAFKNGLRTEMSSVEKSLQTTLLEGVALLINSITWSALDLYMSQFWLKSKKSGRTRTNTEAGQGSSHVLQAAKRSL